MSTVKERIAARRRALAKQVAEGEKFSVPGFNDELWVALRYLADNEIVEINQRHEHAIARLAEQLVVACDGFYETTEDGARDDDGRPVLRPVMVDGKHVRFDRDLAGWMDFADEIPVIGGKIDPVDVLRALMPKEQHIRLLYGAYSVWLVDASSEVDDTLVGESEPTPTS